MGDITSETDLHIGLRLRAARLRRGLAEQWLANQLNVTLDQLQKYEEGLVPLDLDQLDHIARLLKIDVSYFYAGQNGAESAHLSDEGYGLLKRALQQIAADRAQTRTGNRKRLPRHEAIRVAREACEALGWDYGQPNIGKL